MLADPVTWMLGTVGRGGISFLDYIGGMGYLFSESFWHFGRVLVHAKDVRRGGREALSAQMVRVGVKSIPVVCLVLLFVGMILALQGAYVMKDIGSMHLVPKGVGVSILRELGPLLAAIVLTGFAGASIAAEIGTMVVSEEIMALETGGLNPVRFLVMPRLIATITMLFCLTVLADLVGILGGYVISVATLDMTSVRYFNLTIEALQLQDVITGLIKSLGFGAMIALIACLEGLRVRGGAEGVGCATTQAVVNGIVAVISMDLFFTWLFHQVL